MKTTKLFNTGIAIVAIFGMITLVFGTGQIIFRVAEASDYHKKVLKFPADLHNAQRGDFVRVDRVTADTVYLDYYNFEKPTKVIDLPEEIAQAEEGDKLAVYKVQADTVFTQFIHYTPVKH